MSKRRSRLDMLMSMLRLLEKGGQIQTALLWANNISYDVGADLLRESVEASLILFKEQPQKYYITDKGKEALGRYDALRELI